MQRIPVYILAGGKSSRFGSDKARAHFSDGAPLLSRIVRALEPCALSCTAVAEGADKYADLNVRTIADLHPGLGPLAGLHAALKDLPAPGWLLLLSCDFVALDCDWAAALQDASGANKVLSVAFRGEKIEPLCALYHSDLLQEVERSLERGALSPAKLIERVAHKLLPLPANWPALAHINTRDEFARAATK